MTAGPRGLAAIARPRGSARKMHGLYSSHDQSTRHDDGVLRPHRGVRAPAVGTGRSADDPRHRQAHQEAAELAQTDASMKIVMALNGCD